LDRLSRSDFRADSKTRRVAAALATAAALRSKRLVDQTRVGGALSRLGAWHPLGNSDTGSDDCDFHDHLCRNFQSEVRRQQFAMGLCALSFLRAAAVECFSGITATFSQHYCVSCKSGEAGSLSAGNLAGISVIGSDRKSTV